MVVRLAASRIVGGQSPEVACLQCAGTKLQVREIEDQRCRHAFAFPNAVYAHASGVGEGAGCVSRRDA